MSGSGDGELGEMGMGEEGVAGVADRVEGAEHAVVGSSSSTSSTIGPALGRCRGDQGGGVEPSVAHRFLSSALRLALARAADEGR